MLNLKTKTALISQKNTTLLFFEALACMMIVFIHCQFPGNFGIIMNGFARFGVPLFYVVSGFFLVKDGMTVEELRQKLKKRAIRITFLLLFSFVIYFILDAIGICLGSSKTPFLIYLKDLFHWRKILILLICNDPLTSAISWFLIAMLFSYLIIYIFPNVFLKNKVIPIVLSCLCVFWIIFRIIVAAADVSLFGVKLANDIIYRSWYANGLLFISLGVVLKRNEKR